MLLQTALGQMNLLPFANLPGRLNALPLTLDGVGIRALLDLANGSYLLLSVVLQRSLLRAILSQLSLPLLSTPGVLANLPGRCNDLSFRPEAVEVCALRWLTNGPVTVLTVHLARGRMLHRSSTIQAGPVPPLTFGAALDLLGWDAVPQVLTPANAP